MYKSARQEQSEARQFVQEQTQEHQIVVFAKSWCPYCHETRRLLNQPEFSNASVKIINIDEMSNGQAIQVVLYQLTGQRTVPSVWVNGSFLGGNDVTQHAYRAGNLSKLITA